MKTEVIHFKTTQMDQLLVILDNCLGWFHKELVISDKADPMIAVVLPVLNDKDSATVMAWILGSKE